ncbi:hypothetical protein [Clostridium sp.]|uniref:hypothetical protein n=1 Tax=Clostridium sp. TaxID=1506 RepID=UPI001A5C9FFF|nr:hypothetical protein [Clostridium sp.]MBK5240643.1 hypothetical protein [Clostridium sp.]
MNKHIKSSFNAVFIISLFFNIIIFSTFVSANENIPEKVFHLNSDKSINGTLFTSDELIGPGDKLVKKFYIANDNNFNCFLKQIVIDSKFYNKNNVLLKKDNPQYLNYLENLSISFYCEENLIYTGKMDENLKLNFTGDKSIEIENSGKRKFTIEYMLSSDVDKIVMGMQHKFDIDFNFDKANASVTDFNKKPIAEKVVTGSVLVQTGSIIDTKVLIICGSILIILGIMFLKKRKI